MLKLFLKITGLNTKFCSLFFFVYNHNKQEFCLADCGVVNGYAERGIALMKNWVILAHR